MSVTELLDRRRSCLLVVDVQERLLPVIHENELLLQNIRRLVSGADILGLPIIVSEQYPKGLGPTVAPLAEILEQARRLEKITFSCMRDQSIADIKAAYKQQIVKVRSRAEVGLADIKVAFIGNTPVGANRSITPPFFIRDKLEP